MTRGCSRVPNFMYIHDFSDEYFLSNAMDLVIVFEQPVMVAMREDILVGLPDPLRYEEPCWGTRALRVSSQEYPSAAVRLAYNAEIGAYAREQGFDVRTDDIFDRVVDGGFDDEPSTEECVAFFLAMDHWLTQTHQRHPFSIVCSGPLIDLDAYALDSARVRYSVGAWLPRLELTAQESGETAPILSNMLYATMLYVIEELDDEARALASTLLSQVMPDFSTNRHWMELFAAES